MRTYGIFTAYSPGTPFSGEGLGRYLAAFVKGMSGKPDIRLVIACPSWSRPALRKLFSSFDIQDDSYTFLGPRREPFLLGLRNLLQQRKKLTGRRTRRLSRIIFSAVDAVAVHISGGFGRLLSSRNILELSIVGLYLFVLLLLALPFVLAGTAIFVVATLLGMGSRYVWRVARRFLGRPLRRIYQSMLAFQDRYLVSITYRSLLKNEIKIIVSEANARSDIDAWYVPTALWPDVHSLKAPVLICLPDVVLSEFPVGFAAMGDRTRQSYQDISDTLNGSARFVTYSEHVKWSVAVERFGVSPNSVSVINHAPNNLSRHLVVTGFPDIPATTKNYTQKLMASAIATRGGVYQQSDNAISFPFIFYASQLRPSKNVVSLLRAYVELLHQRHFGRKLVLTGDIRHNNEVASFISSNNLRNDVIFLRGLTEAELAAVYGLADLAVNPSLSEGGMPFTFSEALSVGTPVVMADIEVTREIITDATLADASLFDPYDWKGMADKIEWALDNRDALYAQQRAFYDAQLSKRTWDDVVAEHIALMDEIASNSDSRSVQ